MDDKKEWQEFSVVIRELLNLERSPVAVNYVKEKQGDAGKEKARICKAILDASKGKILHVYNENNACFGASWHLGFRKHEDPKVWKMTQKFIVDGEKLFSSNEALDNLISEMGEIPFDRDACFTLQPMELSGDEPDLVIFVCNPDQACRILTFMTYTDGKMPKIKIGGSTCRMAIMYPLFTGEVNVSFQDYTARRLTKMDKDKLLVSIPYKRINEIIDNIDKCSAGRAKIEFPQEFREFLQKRMGVKK